MFGFSKQEQKFILLLCCVFILGVAVTFYKNYITKKSGKEWQTKHQEMLAEFQKLTLKNTDSLEAINYNNVKEHKKFLTKKININNASCEELQTLPKIGPKIAENIIKYRHENGPFKTINEITHVKRIGQKTFEQIKTKITVD